jgi:hypothetical protein
LFGNAATVLSTGASVSKHASCAAGAEWFQAALSDIAHGRQTHEQIGAWLQKAQEVVPGVDYTIAGRHVRTTILWRAPREVFEALPSSDPERVLFVTENLDALLATVLMWLLDREQPFTGLHECGRGEQCELERFYFRNRRYCCIEHTKQVNRASNTQRSRDRRERDKAIELLKPKFPRSARELVLAVKKPGMTSEQLIERAQAEAARKHK